MPAPDVLVRIYVNVEAEGSTGLHDVEDILHVVRIVLLWTLMFESIPRDRQPHNIKAPGPQSTQVLRGFR